MSPKLPLGKPGPFQIIKGDGHGNLEKPIDPPRRRYSCDHYETCLDLACALNWDSFTCRGCSAEVNESLLWRAHHARRKDKVADRLCNIPGIKYHDKDEAEGGRPPLKIVSEV